MSLYFYLIMMHLSFQCKYLVMVGMIKLDRFHVELNSLLPTENWYTSIWTFSVSTIVIFS